MPRVRVIFRLDAFSDTEDLDKMWTVIRPELEQRLGKKNFICLPHLTDGNYYGVGSVFVKVKQSGIWFLRRCTFLPLGPIESLINTQSTETYWHTKHPFLYSASSQMGLTHYLKKSKDDICTGSEEFGFSIILQDPMGHKELKLNVESVHARPIPFGTKAVDTIMFDLSANPELRKTNEIYLVTSVIEVDRLELTGTIGARSRVYHIIHRYPLFFTYNKYKIDKDGRVISKVKCRPSARHSTWIRMNETENIDDVPRPDWENFS